MSKICPLCNYENDDTASHCLQCNYMFPKTVHEKLDEIFERIETEEPEYSSPENIEGRTTAGVAQRERAASNGLRETSQGKINGVKGRGYPVHRAQIRKKKQQKRVYLYLVPVITIILICVALGGLLLIKKERIQLDGEFSDWEGAKKSQFSAGIVPTQIDIVNAAIESDEKWYYFLVEVRGEIFEGDAKQANAGYMDILHIFVDADCNPETGYFVRGIGADYVLNLGGCRGEAQIHEVYKFDESRGNFDWQAKIGYGSIDCAKSLHAVELRVQKKIFNSENIEVIYHMFSYNGAEDFSDYIVSNKKPALVCNVKYAGNEVIDNAAEYIRVELTAPQEDVTLKGIVLKEVGSSQPVDVEYSINGGARARETFSGAKEIGFNTVITKTKTEIVFYLNASAHLPESAVGIEIDGRESVKAEGVVSVSESQDAGKAKVSYVKSAPAKIIIDGAFADWRDKQLEEDEDDAPAQYNIKKFGAVREDSTINLYLSVEQNLLGGIDVPYTGPVKISGSGGGGVIPSPPLNATDFVSIYIQKGSPPVGYKIGHILANYFVEINGKNGKILSKKYFVFNASGDWEFAGYVAAEIDNYQIEVKLMIDENASMVFVTSDWKENKDYTNESNPIGRASATLTVDPLPHAQTKVVVSPVVETKSGGIDILDAPFTSDTNILGTSPKLNGSNPSACVAANGTIYVAYQQNNSETSHGVFVRAGIEGLTSAWATSWSKNSTTTNVTNPSICVDPITQNIYVAYENATFSFGKYTNASNVWAEYYIPGWDSSKWKNPSIVAYNDIVYIFYENESTTNPGKYDIGFVNSTDGGNTWNGYFYFNETTTDERNPSAGINANYVFIAFQNETGGNYNITWYYSADGENWNGWYTPWAENEMYPSISISGNYGYVAFQDDTYGDRDIYCFWSTDEFATSPGLSAVALSTNDELFPSVAANGAFANIAFINITGTKANISYSNTTNNGQTWLSPLRVNDNDGEVRVYPGCLVVTNKSSALSLWAENSSTANSLTAIYHAEIAESGDLSFLALFVFLIAPVVFWRKRKRD
ncbi:MAG: hypothetical protein QXU48_03765 [Thermoplasmata archaeon]